MKHIALLLISILVMTANANAAERNDPPADYKGVIAEKPQFQKGDRWDYVRRDKNVSYEFIEEKDGQLFFDIRWDDGTREAEIRTSDLNFIRSIDGKGEITEEVSPYRGWFSFPLWVGKKWSYTFRTSETKRAAGMSSDRDSDVKVVAYEQIKVPAGTFWAFKIEELRTIRGAKRGQRATGYHVTAWYSPEVKGNVKIEQDSDVYNRDLVRFSKGK